MSRLTLINIKKYFSKIHSNQIDAFQNTLFLARLVGLMIYDIKMSSKNRSIVIGTLNYFGLLMFLFISCTCFFSYLISIIEDQSIIRIIFDTKLEHYGDFVERAFEVPYLTYQVWKMAFNLHASVKRFQDLIDVEKVVSNCGETVDVNLLGRFMFMSAFAQFLAFFIRLTSIWALLLYLGVPIPMEKVFIVTASNTCALLICSNFNFQLKFLKERYRIINNGLEKIVENKSWESVLFSHSNMRNKEKASQLQDKYTCEKIRGFAKLYISLYVNVRRVNEMFGLVLMITVLVSLMNVILNMFYFMEATAAGLYHDHKRYWVLVIYLFWQIGYSISIVLVIVYYPVKVIKEANRTGCFLHKIINNNISPTIRREAMLMSTQVLNEKPVFVACGLFEFNNALLLSFLRSVMTFGVILLQFAASPDKVDSDNV